MNFTEVTIRDRVDRRSGYHSCPKVICSRMDQELRMVGSSNFDFCGRSSAAIHLNTDHRTALPAIPPRHFSCYTYDILQQRGFSAAAARSGGQPRLHRKTTAGICPMSDLSGLQRAVTPVVRGLGSLITSMGAKSCIINYLHSFTHEGAFGKTDILCHFVPLKPSPETRFVALGWGATHFGVESSPR